MLNAHTLEIDDAELARQEILAQLDLSGLAKNSVGLISCHHEFIDNGIVRDLCAALPFEVIGLTTMVTLVSGKYDMYMLGLTVLTSDEVVFKTVSTAELTYQNCAEEINRAYSQGRAGFPADPALILTVFPFLKDTSASLLLKHLDQAGGGAPVWGTVVSDDDMSFGAAQTICNGISSASALVMILLYGPVNPRFIMTALPDRNVSPRRVVVTESDGYVVKTVNDLPLKDFFKSMGIAVLKEGPDATAVPIMLNYGDGTPSVASAFYNFYPDGSGLAGVEVPQNATFSLGEIDYDGIIETAGQSLTQALSAENIGGMLMFPCVTRYVMTSPRSADEMQLVVERIAGKFPYMLAYSGGEVCPAPGADGKLHNRFHNYTFVACSF
jgi:hypothetical protein